MDNSSRQMNWHGDLLGVNKMGKNIKKIPMHQPNFTGTARQQPLSQVYNTHKNNFRNIVQQLTGSPSYHQEPPAPRAPKNSPKPANMLLQKLRPPPLTIINRPPMAILQPPVQLTGSPSHYQEPPAPRAPKNPPKPANMRLQKLRPPPLMIIKRPPMAVLQPPVQLTGSPSHYQEPPAPRTPKNPPKPANMRLQKLRPPPLMIIKRPPMAVLQPPVQLTGSPSHYQEPPAPRPPQNPPKPAIMLLQKIRPPPLTPINRSPMTVQPPVPVPAAPAQPPAGTSAPQCGQPLQTMLPPWPNTSESPISAYMRYLQNSIIDRSMRLKKISRPVQTACDSEPSVGNCFMVQRNSLSPGQCESQSSCSDGDSDSRYIEVFHSDLRPPQNPPKPSSMRLQKIRPPALTILNLTPMAVQPPVKLTGLPSHHQEPPAPRAPPKNSPKPANMRLQKLRPPPLMIIKRPPMAVLQPPVQLTGSPSHYQEPPALRAPKNPPKPANMRLQKLRPPPLMIIKKPPMAVLQPPVQLTGSPSHYQEPPAPRPPQNPPKPAIMLLEKIRPLPLTPLNRPPMAMQPPVPVPAAPAQPPAGTSASQCGQPLQTMLPPWPNTSESPISAYMRYLQNSIIDRSMRLKKISRPVQTACDSEPSVGNCFMVQRNSLSPGHCKSQSSCSDGDSDSRYIEVFTRILRGGRG